MSLFRKDVPPYPTPMTSAEWDANRDFWLERSRHYGDLSMKSAKVAVALACVSILLAVVSVALRLS